MSAKAAIILKILLIIDYDGSNGGKETPLKLVRCHRSRSLVKC